MAFAALDDFARARLVANEAEEIGAGAHGRVAGLDEMTGGAAHVLEGLFAQSHEIAQLFLVGVAARGLGQRQLIEVRGFVACVTHRERPLRDDDESGPALVFALPDGDRAGSFEKDATARVGAVAHVERESVVELGKAGVEPRRAETHGKRLPLSLSLAITHKFKGVAAHEHEVRACACGRAVLERGDAVGQRGARDQPAIRGCNFCRERAVFDGPRRVVAESR